MKIFVLILLSILVLLIARSATLSRLAAEPLAGLPVGKEGASAVEAEPAPGTSLPTNEDFLARAYRGGSFTVVQDVGREGRVHRYVVSYPSDGLTVRAVMTFPTSAMPETGYPVVILNHGHITEPTHYQALKAYVPYETYYAEHGFLVVKPDYRGHGLSEGEAHANGYSPGYVVDILNLIASLKMDCRANAERLYMVGHSLGGLCSLQCAEISPDIKAVVDYAGSPPHPRLRHALRPKAAELSASFDFQFDQIRAHIAALRMPVQIHNGMMDQNMPFAFAENFYELLYRSRKKNVEFFAYADAGHIFQGFDLDLFLERTLDLFNGTKHREIASDQMLRPDSPPWERFAPLPPIPGPVPFFGPRNPRPVRPLYPRPPYPPF